MELENRVEALLAVPLDSLVEVSNAPTENRPAASMEVHHPPPLRKKLCPAALMEVYRPPELPHTAALVEVHRPPSTEEHPDASVEELPAADSMAAIDFDDPNYLSSFPIGYRFQPTHYELIVYYLKEKIAGKKLPPSRIHEVNVYLVNPETLAGTYFSLFFFIFNVHSFLINFGFLYLPLLCLLIEALIFVSLAYRLKLVLMS